MTRILSIIVSVVVFCSVANAQSTIENILGDIEKNNTTIQALRQSADAEKIANKTGITPSNPEVEFGYLWGSPSAIGNRTDFSVTQSFDFPTAYLRKGQIANSRNSKVEFEYQSKVREIKLRASEICIDLIYLNALQSEYKRRFEHAKGISDSYKRRYDVGDVNILDYNKAQIYLLNATKELESNDVERKSLLTQLASLNGGKAIEFTDTVLANSTINPEFSQWYTQAEQNNPALAALKQEIEATQREVQLSRALSLPKFNAGYMSEKVAGEHFQGITVGLSIPLWENKNTVRYAKSRFAAYQSAEADSKLKYYNHLMMLHQKALGMQSNVDDYRTKLKSFSNTDLLQKALDKGEISLVEYLYELSFYYDSFENLLEMERDLNRVVVEMNYFQ
ncbi:MAG: TolC family protein [Bacteroidales bacterium]|nr:MAG: TolC family protein [Bacteroidales bacterium]